MSRPRHHRPDPDDTPGETTRDVPSACTRRGARSGRVAISAPSDSYKIVVFFVSCDDIVGLPTTPVMQ